MQRFFLYSEQDILTNCPFTVILYFLSSLLILVLQGETLYFDEMCPALHLHQSELFQVEEVQSLCFRVQLQ